MKYNKDNIIVNYQNKYLNVKYKDVLNLFNDRYVSGIKDNNLNETLVYKDYENINKVVEIINSKGNAFDFIKNISLKSINKFNEFINMLVIIYNYFNSLRNYNLEYDDYLKSIVDLSSNNTDEIKHLVAKHLNKLEELDEVIEEYYSDITDKYNKVLNNSDYVETSTNESDFEFDVDRIKEYSNSLNNVKINLDEFKNSSKSLEDNFEGINIKDIIIECIDIVTKHIRSINSFIETYLSQLNNNEDNIIFYLETNSLGLLNEIGKTM